ncbi:MAG: hypothetical protein KC609_03485 [Myxococcales bacterium]|nr:hypothetical protein [Myxococcales bacterium]
MRDATSDNADLEGDRGFVGDQTVLPSIQLEPLFTTAERDATLFRGCLLASPQHYVRKNGVELLIVADGGGFVTALDPLTGEVVFRTEMPAPAGEAAMIVGTPALVGSLLVVGYHTRTATGPSGPGPNVTDLRHRHRVAVVDLEAGVLDDRFRPFDLQASKPTADGKAMVAFLAANNLGRAEVIHARAPGDTLGRVYLTFGNARDLQPWHGWVFEINLDHWLASGSDAAISATLVTTPEVSCGQPGTSGSRERSCGGGLWAPSGPLLVPRGETFELILAPGNGQLDLARRDYANTLMRTGPGLPFDPRCDATACADFDPNAPALDCIESCADLFIPRVATGDPPLAPESGVCSQLTMFQCWQRLDYVGGSTPVHLTTSGGREVLAYPTKDGHIYLVDASTMGIQYQRLKLADVCGTEGDPCQMDWAGMIVTQPAVITPTSGPADAWIFVATFEPDTTHEAGLYRLDLAEPDGVPRLTVGWRFPPIGDPDAKSLFRRHPSRVAIGASPRPFIAIVDVAPSDRQGRLTLLDPANGAPLSEIRLAGPGYRFTKPAVVGERIYVNTCASDSGPGGIEAFRIR